MVAAMKRENDTAVDDRPSRGRHQQVLVTPERMRHEMAEIATWAPHSTITITDPADPDRVFVITGITTNVMTSAVELTVQER